MKRFTEARQQMTDEFKAIAGDVLKSHGETFSKQNREQVDTLLKPLQDKITEFHKNLVEDRSAMGERIRALAESNLQITTEAQNLTRALKGNSQTQGAWGEMILSTILEQSGLREGEQYFTQQSHSGEDGQRVRTDVEILMPNGDKLVIDSKVSLTAFEAFVNSEELDRDQHLRAHITSVRGHITTLGDKSYHRAAKSSLDYVMMFVPIESALATAIQHDTKLVEFGMGKGVMLTTPTTLMTVLRTVRNVWDIEKRHQNAEEIAERAGALYEKVAGFLGTMDKVGSSIERASQDFAKAKDQLSTGRGNVVRQVEMLRELGAKSGKSLPAGWDGGSDEQPTLRLVGEEPGDRN
jgi:DNA recombination protein RmuC